MSMKQCALSILYCLSCFNNILTLSIGNSQGQHQWTIVIKNVSNCNMPGLNVFLENVSMHYHYPKTHLDICYRVTEDYKGLIKFIVHIERCNNQGYDCEDYQNWRFDRCCDMIRWKNQIWSELVDRVKPPFRCPIKRGIYEARNASINVDGIINWNPIVQKYHWEIGLKAISEDNDVQFCGIVGAYFQLTEKPDRKPSSRRPKHT